MKKQSASSCFALFLFLLLSTFNNSNAQWVQVSNGLSNTNVVSITGYDNKIFAGTQGDGVYFSTDYGENWVQDGLSPYIVEALAVMGNIIFAGTENHGVFKTTDDGQNWNPTSLNQEGVGSFWIDGNNIFAACWKIIVGPTGVFLSTDSGNTWNLMGLSGMRIFGISGSGNYVYTGIRDYGPMGVEKSTDYGNFWVQSFSLWPVSCLAANGSYVYAGTVYSNAGLYYSNDYGITWDSTSINNDNVHSLLTINTNVFVGTHTQGIYLSTNNGVSFYQINDGLGSSPPQIKELYTLNNYLFAGTINNGVYRRSLDEIIPVELTTFTASISNDNEVVLNWSTSTETNNNGFDVERSQKLESGNQNRQKIGFVEGHGTTAQQHNYSYTDKNLLIGIYQYRLKQTDFDGNYKYSDVVEAEIKIPLKFTLEQNYPNPFNPSTKIRYAIPNRGQVKLSVYNLLGEEVAVLVNKFMEAGYHETVFDAASAAGGLSSGTYIYKIDSDGLVAAKKMLLMK